MKRQMFLATAFSAALAVGAAAQTGTSTQPGSQQTVTVTGCLQQATPSGSAGTSGTATGTGAASADSKFILTNAKVEGGSGSTAGSTGTATSGTAGTAGASAMGNRYKLSGGDEDDLKKYLNSQRWRAAPAQGARAAEREPGAPARAPGRVHPMRICPLFA